MAEIIWGAPLVEFAQFQVHATAEELGVKDLADGYSIGYAYALWFKAVSEGFTDGVAAARDAVGKAQEVTGQYQESPEEAPPGDPSAAAARLKAGKKPRTVPEADEMAKQLIENELGATTVEPWTKTQPQAKKAWDDFDL